ncbi:unnamed protein product [Closterium sp. NIES-54]
MATITVVAAARGGQQQQLPLPDTLSPQQLREWVIQRARPGGGGFGFLRTAQRRQHSQQETYSPQLLSELFSQRCVLRSVEAAALGASESAAALGASDSAAAPGASESAAALGARASTATGPASAKALHTFTLDSGASRCFFRDSTTLTPLAALVPVSLADPTGGLVVARASTILPCPAFPSGSLSGLHLPEFSTSLLSNTVLQDDTFIPGGQRVAICKCSQTGRHLATFTRQPGSGLYTLTTASAQVDKSGQVATSSRVSASGQLATSCSCRVLSHQTLLWHHRLGHHSLPRLCSMHSRLHVSGLPRSLPSLSRSPAPPCLPCVEGRQCAAPHSSEFPPTTAPLQTLQMDVWGSAPVGGTDLERYFLLVVYDYTRYTTDFPLRRKVDVSSVLIPWIRATLRQLRERFHRDFPVLRLHSDRGSEFSSDLLAEFCQEEGIRQLFTLLASPQQNGIDERRIGLIMEVARTSMIHAAAPHFLWPFAVRYGVHQLNIWPRVSEPETSPTLQWTGKVGDASVFRVWGALSLVRDAKASKLSSRTLRCVLASPPTPRRGSSTTRASVESSPPRTSPLTSLVLLPQLRGVTLPLTTRRPLVNLYSMNRRSPCLETPPGFPPRPSSPPPQPAAVDSGGGTAGAKPGGAKTKGEGSGGVATRGADSGGAASPSGGGAVGDPAEGPGTGQPPQPDLLETLLLQAIRANPRRNRQRNRKRPASKIASAFAYAPATPPLNPPTDPPSDPPTSAPSSLPTNPPLDPPTDPPMDPLATAASTNTRDIASDNASDTASGDPTSSYTAGRDPANSATASRDPASSATASRDPASSYTASRDHWRWPWRWALALGACVGVGAGPGARVPRWRRQQSQALAQALALALTTGRATTKRDGQAVRARPGRARRA